MRLDADPFGDENTLLVNELTATEFRKGYGKGIMQDLIEQAEEQGKKLTLFPQQLDDITGGMDDEALVSFYKSLGFKPVLDQRMTRRMIPYQMSINI